MNDAATVMNRPKPLVVGGREYLLHRLSFDDHGAVQRWLDAQLRNPLTIVREEIAAADYPLEIQKFMLKSAIEIASRNRILVGTPEADALLDTLEGKAEMLRLSIAKGVPDFSHKQAMDLLRQMDELAREEAAAAADVLRVDEDPKAPAGGGSTSPEDPAPPRLSTGGPGSTS
jgi:hypothetical protein